MPSPLGHLLGGAAVYLAGTEPTRRSSFVLGSVLIGSILPDFDFLPGLLIGRGGAFHHGISHSLLLAFVFGGLVFAVARRVESRIAVRAAVLATLAYVSHVLLDFVAVNPGTRGVPLLWPLVDDRLGVNLRLFGYFRHTNFSDGTWGVIRWVNVLPVLRELLILGALVIVLLQKGRIWHWFLRLSTRLTNRHQ